VVSDLVRVELVKAEEAEIPKDITEMIPDPALRKEIAKYAREGKENDGSELTIDELKDNDKIFAIIIEDKDCYSLQGIEYVEWLKELVIFGTSIDDISVLEKVNGLKALNLKNNKITNFDVLSILSQREGFQLMLGDNATADEVTITEDTMYIYDDLELDLSLYIGKNNNIEIKDIIINSEGSSVDELYNSSNNKIVISDLLSKTPNNNNGEYSGNVTVILDQELPYEIYGNGNNIVTTTIVQPYTIKVPSPGTGNETSNIEKITERNIMTDRKELTIYNQYGKETGTKNLTEEITDFTTNRVNEVNGVKYYEIGDNAWIEADKVKEFYFNDSYIQTHASSFKELTKLDSNPVTDRVLAKNSDWYSDRYVYLDDKLHYRVSTHEWVRDGHVVQYESVNGVVHANETASLYNSEGVKVTDRALAKGSTFFADKKATIEDKLMYRVATDEWVDADTVTFK